MKFFESFRTSKKTDEEVSADYTSAHEKLLQAAEDLNKAHAEHRATLNATEDMKAQARESLERSLKELENLNP